MRRHIESIELADDGTARHRVELEFEVPSIAWSGVPVGTPCVVPIGLVEKGAAAGARVVGEDGSPVALLPPGWSAEIVAAGLVALAEGIGADGEVRRVAWRIAAGPPSEARQALIRLARGETPELRRAWEHQPFRSLAERLVDHSVLLVALHQADLPRGLMYSHGEPVERLEDGAARGPRAWLSRLLHWDGLHLRLALPHLGEAAYHRVRLDAGPDVDVSTTVDEERRVADVRVRLTERALRRAPATALVTAVALTAAWVAAPRIEGAGRLLWLLLLAVPLALTIHVARLGERQLLLRGVRSLLLVSGALSLVSAVVVAAGASTPVLRVTVGIAAALAWGVAVLLLETRRRALGGAPPVLPRLHRAPARAPVVRFDATRLALLACVMAAGLLVVALAYDAARDGDGGAHALFWVGVVVIFVAGLLHGWRAPSRGEAVVGVVLLGVALYLVKVLHSPIGFTFHDEFSTLRTTLDIQRFGHLFEDNPLIEVHPFYPALELVTSAISSVTGLSIFVSGVLVVGVLRVAMMAALFLLFEAASSSTRVAALATVLYACNPNFLFFDSQWAYESFALPLALVAVAMVARGRTTALLSLPVVLALCVAHPLTSLALIALLLVWAGVDRALARRDGGEQRRELWVVALVGGAFLVVWAVFVARSTGGYLGPVLREAGGSLVDLLLGQSGPKRIFGATEAGDTPVVERLLGFAAVALALAAVAFGLRPLWRRFTPLGAALAAAALLYPVSLALRLTEAGTEISNRASEFVFVGVAFLGALALTEAAPGAMARLGGRLPRLMTPAAAAAAAVLFAGGVVVGNARTSRVPGGYLVVADPRSIEPEGLEAAHWSRQRLGPGNRVVADRINGLLWGSIGLQEPQVGRIAGRSVPGVVTAPRLDQDVRFALINNDLRFVVADLRLATGLPEVGFYFEKDEPNAYEHTRPPALGALLKFDSVCPVGRVLHSDFLVVYDTRRMRQELDCYGGPPRPGGVRP